MKNNSYSTFTITASLLLWCVISFAQKPFYNKPNRNWNERVLPKENVAHTVYLIGDAGAKDTSKISPVMNMLRSQLDRNDENTSVIFLGDNIYSHGMPDSLEEGYDGAVLSITKQLEVVKGIKGKVVFVPGNHDWNKGKKGGWNHVMNQQRFVDRYLEGKASFPGNGCPGPEEISITDKFKLLTIDTQWWLNREFKPGVNEGCSSDDRFEFMKKMREEIERNQDKSLLVVGHHPLVSNGVHGGNFSIKDHVFPLTAVSKKLYVPLPIIGSIYPLYRKNIGNIQDMAHLTYREMNDSLTAALQSHKNVIYAAGHEHIMEYDEYEGIHHIISGSGSKETHTGRSAKTDFIYKHRGFAKLLCYKNGEIWLEMWQSAADEKPAQVAYRKKIIAAESNIQVAQQLTQPLSSFTNYTDSVIHFPGFAIYNTGKLNRFFLGEHYRKSWITPLKLPVIDLKREHGGLSILQRGGGFQTISVRMENEKGHQYVLRSIQKDPQTVIPKVFRRTFAKRLLQDQISASQPYGAVVVPQLADAAGIYHTNPKIVYIPDETYLGQYRSAIANTVALYEERPKGDMSHAPQFGRATKIVGTPDVLEKIRKNHKHRVDQQFVIKSRIFDIFLNDWDRHEDQWRWARFDDDHGRYYRPIPRDRDQVFYKFDGVINWIASRKWAVRKFQTFREKTDDIAGLGFNARFFDRFFTTEMEMEDWVKAATEMQASLTDEVIDAAVKDLPPEIYANDGEWIASTLKKRRVHLVDMAKRHYLFLSETVQLDLTEKNEYVEVIRKDKEHTEVRVYTLKNKKEKGRLLYDRTFKTSETKEVRIFGFGGKDYFVLDGTVKKGVKVRIKGGKGKDTFINHSRVKGLSKKTIIYDRKKNSKVEAKNGDTKMELSKKKAIHSYEPRWFKYNVTAPMVSFGMNPDDGIFLGGGVSIKRFGFEKAPYSSHQKIFGAYAPRTGSFNLHYNGDFINVIKKIDLEIGLQSLVPSAAGNFYGLGVNTEALEDEEFYRIRFEEHEAELMLKRRLTKSFRIRAGGFLTTYELERTSNRFVTSDLSGFAPEAFDLITFGGWKVNFELNKKDNTIFTKRGIYWNTSLSQYHNLDVAADFIKFETDLRFYYTLFLPFEATLVNRVGWSEVSSGAPFYLAARLEGDNRISNKGNIRGFRRGRFTDNSAYYLNNDIRIPFLDLSNTRLSGKMGGLGFFDYGTVGDINNAASDWYDSYGGGLWYSPFNQIILSATYAISEEDNFIYFNTGFAF